MYIVKIVKTGKGNIRGIMPLLSAWYSIRKFYRKGNTVYYLVADEESLSIFKKVFMYNGYDIVRYEPIEKTPWYLEEFINEFINRAKELKLKRECLYSIVNEGISIKEIPSKFKNFAKNIGLSSAKLSKILERISKSILVWFNPRIDLEEFMKYAVKVGLVPLTNMIYYTGSFSKKKSKYDKVIDELESIPPYSEFNSRIKDFLVHMYGLEAKKIFTSLHSSFTYQETLLRSKIDELRKVANFDYNLYRVS